MTDESSYNRRRFLSSLSLAATFSLAGCAGQPSDSETSTVAPQTPTNRPTSTARDTPTDTPTESSTTTTTTERVAEATTSDASLEVTEGQYRTTAAVTGTVENTGNVPLLICNAVAKFYNEDDELLNTNGWQVMGLLPGETWVPWLQYYGDGSKVERATLEVDSTNPARKDSLYSGGSSFQITETNVQVPVDEGAMPRFTAKVRNETGSEVTRVRFLGKVYDDAGRVLAHGTRVVNAFGAGEVWDVEAPMNMEGDRGDQISSHEVLLYT